MLQYTSTAKGFLMAVIEISHVAQLLGNAMPAIIPHSINVQERTSF